MVACGAGNCENVLVQGANFRGNDFPGTFQMLPVTVLAATLRHFASYKSLFSMNPGWWFLFFSFLPWFQASSLFRDHWH